MKHEVTWQHLETCGIKNSELESRAFGLKFPSPGCIQEIIQI